MVSSETQLLFVVRDASVSKRLQYRMMIELMKRTMLAW